MIIWECTIFIRKTGNEKFVWGVGTHISLYTYCVGCIITTSRTSIKGISYSKLSICRKYDFCLSAGNNSIGNFEKYGDIYPHTQAVGIMHFGVNVT